MCVGVVFFFANRYYRVETCLWLLYIQNGSVFTEDNSQFQMQRETVVQSPREHMLLSYHLVLPYLPGSP